MRRGTAHAPAAKADIFRRMNSQGLITFTIFDLGWTLAMRCCAMYSEVCWPKLQEAGGTRPGRCGGRAVFGRSFVSFPFGRPWGPVGVEAPGSRPVHGSWTAPARIRDGTQGIANPKGSSSTAAFGGSFGAGPRQVCLCEQPHEVQICNARAEPFRLPASRQVCNIAGRGGHKFSFCEGCMACMAR